MPSMTNLELSLDFNASPVGADYPPLGDKSGSMLEAIGSQAQTTVDD